MKRKLAVTAILALALLIVTGCTVSGTPNENGNKVVGNGGTEIELEHEKKGLKVEVEQSNGAEKEYFIDYKSEEYQKIEEEFSKLDDRVVDDRSSVSKEGLNTKMDAQSKASIEKNMKMEKEELHKVEYIGMDKAKAIVMASLNLANVHFTDMEVDDGVYELEFVFDGMEYECEVDALSGDIVKVKKERLD